MRKMMMWGMNHAVRTTPNQRAHTDSISSGLVSGVTTGRVQYCR